MKENQHVKTAIRWRPSTENREVCIAKVNNNLINVKDNLETFQVDNVFDSSEQSEVFDVLVKPLIDKAIEGFDFTFVAIGQSGSGKTFTMGFERSVDPENSGIVTRVLNALFSHKIADQCQMQISFVEIYNNQAFDLLKPNVEKPFRTKTQCTKDASKEPVNSVDEVLTLLSKGIEKRRVCETKMNSISSRSHVIFTIFLNITQDENSIRPSVINLVDLAGSEGFQNTGNTGQARTEGKNINENLITFKRVIKKMASNRPDTHIPYRESVITRLLQNSLNFRSYLTLLGCISPYKDDKWETLTTLRFVCEAKELQMTPHVREIINNYRKSMTPVRQTPVNRSLHTTSSLMKSRKLPMKSLSSYKQPLKTIQNKPPFSSASKVYSRLSAMNSTSKKLANHLSGTHRKSFDNQAKKPKAVINLFPTKENETTFEHESISGNFSNVSSSSVIEVEPITPKPSNLNQSRFNQTELLRKKLGETLFEVKTPIRNQIIDNTLKVVSNHLKDNNDKAVEQNEVNDTKPEALINQSSPLNEPLVLEASPSPPQPPSQPSATVFVKSSPMETPIDDNCVDSQIPIKTSVDKIESSEMNEDDSTLDDNVITMIENDNAQGDSIDTPMDVDQVDEKILMTTSTNHVPVDSPQPCVTDQVESAILSSESFPRLDVISEVPEVNSIKETPEKTIEKSISDCTSVHENVSIAKSELSQVKQKLDESIPNIGNFNKYVSPLIVRKMEKMLEDDSVYEIVKKSYDQSPIIESCAEFLYPVFDYSLSTPPNGLITEQSPAVTSKTPVDSPVKIPAINRSKSVSFAFSPRVVLHRIENIREYQQAFKRASSQMDAADTQKTKRTKVTRTESNRKTSRAIATTKKAKATKATKTTKATKSTKATKTTKAKAKSTSTPNEPTNVAPTLPPSNPLPITRPDANQILNKNRERVLDTLNNGTEKDIGKLPTIGPKKASTIFNHRELNGKFTNIDGMKVLLSNKVYQKFLMQNNLVIL